MGEGGIEFCSVFIKKKFFFKSEKEEKKKRKKRRNKQSNKGGGGKLAKKVKRKKIATRFELQSFEAQEKNSVGLKNEEKSLWC